MDKHSQNSSFREKLIEHLLIGELLKYSWQRGDCTLGLSRPEGDRTGYDLVAECNGYIRHIQLKTTKSGARAAGQKVHIALADIKFNRYNEVKLVNPAVTSVECKDDYLLSVAFDSGESGLLDMKPYLNFGVFRKIQDPCIFKTAHVSFDTIAWESGADLAPEFVYKNCRIVK